MKPLTDNALDRLRTAAELPDLTGTRYRVVSKLGQGGMGSVYCVEDETLGRQVALKVIALSDTVGEFRNRLLHEARVIAQLEHPGIVPVHDVGTLPDGRVFYTMKLVQGQRLDQHRSGLTTLTERLRLFQRICEPMAFAHAHGVLHRDLKPQNIMVGPFGEVLVLDWGLSKLLDSSRETNFATTMPNVSTDTQHGAVLGTPGYMSPEQAGSNTRVGYPTDVYSLGAILKFLLRRFRFGAAPSGSDPKKMPRAGAFGEILFSPGTGIGYRTLCRRRCRECVSGRAICESLALGATESSMAAADCGVPGHAHAFYSLEESLKDFLETLNRSLAGD